MSYKILIKNSAKPDLKKIRESNLKNSFEKILKTLEEDPYKKSDHFEPLQPKHEGYYSRRINLKHRVVYKIDDTTKTVTIYAAWSHYQ